MSWYYADGGKQIGPVSKGDLDHLIHSGAMPPSTLVWTEGMSDWQAYSQAGTAADAPSPAGEAEARVVCAECGRIFPEHEVIRYGASALCAECKPVFLQRLREGAALATGLRFAGFWIRGGALLVDSIILWVVNTALGALVIAMAVPPGASPEDTGVLLVQLVVILIQMIIGLVYEVWFLGRFGATPGKMACGIHVVTATGEPISYLRALGRSLAKILSGLLLGVGYLIAAFDEEKRTLHDRICDTRVVFK